MFACAAIALPAILLAGNLSLSWTAPVDHPAIRYPDEHRDDAIAHLQKRLDSGETKFGWDDRFGYLPSVLKALNVPQSSQVLVFSKTSFQAALIGPKSPRALYFNDHVWVGFVRGGDVLEFAALDPRQGVTFYTLDRQRADHPQFQRFDSCIQCHQSAATTGIPGVMVRSVTPDRTGMPTTSLGGFITDHKSQIKDRWGGWYVTGTTGEQEHTGNVFLQNSAQTFLHVSDATRNVTDLNRFIDTSAYLTPHSDIVALMTLEHETQMANLMIRVGWEARIALHEEDEMNRAFRENNAEPAGQNREATSHRINLAVEDLLEYTLFSREARIREPITGTSGFAAAFEKTGPRDLKDRSLYEFDLKTRMFRYPCSFLVYSEAWDNMPQIVKDRLYLRMWEVLSGKDQSPAFANLTPADRQAIAEILIATKKDLPAYWKLS